MRNNCNRSSGTLRAMRYSQCAKEERCMHKCRETRKSGCALLSRTRVGECRPNRSNICLSRSLLQPEAPDLASQLFIKSFASMVVQLMCEVAKDREQKSPLSFHAREEQEIRSQKG